MTDSAARLGNRDLMLMVRRTAGLALVAMLVAATPAAFAEYRFAGLNARDLTPLAAGSFTVAAEDETVLAAEGFGALPVVFEDEPRARMAATYLASALREMSGVEVPLYRLAPGAANGFVRSIFVGQPDSGDAFAVAVTADGVSFSGRTDFAAYDFCERVLGVRQYWDGPSGTSVRKGSRIAVPHLAYRDAPVFPFRQYYGAGGSVWLRVAKAGDTFGRSSRCHTTDDGFCYGSPEGFAEYCRRVDADIAGGERFVRVVDRERKAVHVSPWDVAYGCRCRWCRTLEGHLCKPAGTMTPVIWGWFLPRLVRYLARRHPDYRVNVLPYWNYVDAPPPGTDIGTNVQAEVCSMSGLAAFKWDEVREREEGIILDWERLTGRKVANWHYSCWPAEYTDAPYVYGRTIAAHYRRMRDHTVGSFINGGRDDFPRFAISLYVWMRCLWNPDVDVDAVYDEFCVRQFGAAAKPMRELIEVQEEEWNPRLLNFSEKSMRKLSRLMEESAELVRGTSAASAFLYYNSGFSAAFDRRAPDR